MRQSAPLNRLFLVTGLLGGLAMLAYQPAPPAKVAAPKPVAAQVVPVLLIDREPRATAGAGTGRIGQFVHRDPPDHCFGPHSQANAEQRLQCG
ncbi:hypothetical protein [uncultured Rhodoblastus sp.]|uniref:hypothetical protein n=1 Tax=uncultured Rhodoblastus sp. TaxID=543037 RepID=UPI0025FDEAE7|nr:hypothetical protein [uncultured Rhodoblastus sp.]